MVVLAAAAAVFFSIYETWFFAEKKTLKMYPPINHVARHQSNENPVAILNIH